MKGQWLFSVEGLLRRAWCVNNLNNRSNANGNNNLNNDNGRLVGIVKLLSAGIFLLFMGLLFDKVCEYENLKEAFQRARKGKTLKTYVLDFERDLEVNLREFWEKITR